MSEEKLRLSEFAKNVGQGEKEVRKALVCLGLSAKPNKSSWLIPDHQKKILAFWEKSPKDKSTTSSPPKISPPPIKSEASTTIDPSSVASIKKKEEITSPSHPINNKSLLPTNPAQKTAKKQKVDTTTALQKPQRIGSTVVTRKKQRKINRPPIISPLKEEDNSPSMASPPENVTQTIIPQSHSPQQGHIYDLQVQKQKDKEAGKLPPPKGEETTGHKATAIPEKSTAPPEATKPVITINKDAIIKYRKRRRQTMSHSAINEKVENQHIFQKPTEPVIRQVKIPESISVSRLASEMSIKSNVLIRKLMDQGINITANELLDRDTAWLIVDDLGHQPVEDLQQDLEQKILSSVDDNIEMQPRAPVVTIMGHVDHGKTSLLDYIRKTKVVNTEAGGITQHIGAYRVQTAIGDVTLIDTPGHALFTQMRARGARITDIVVLVVAADDGIKQQTIEAINHAKDAGVPTIVAVNKIDKPEADIERVKSQLSHYPSVLPEDWGGDAMVVGVSAHSGEGVEQLLEAVATQADLLDLKAPINLPAKGIVVEARMEKGRGVVATVIVTQGILKLGDTFLCGAESGRLRTMWNATSKQVKAAYPSQPVEVQGLSKTPAAGAELWIIDDERKAREVANLRQDELRNKRLSRSFSLKQEQNGVASVETMLDAQDDANTWKEVKVVIKTDVEGSREALVSTLSAISGKKAGVKVIHSAVGAVNESDIYLAQASVGLVVAFNVRPNGKSKAIAESRNIRIITANVIYELEEKIREVVLSLLPPIIDEQVVGKAAVRAHFTVNKSLAIAGSQVLEGIVRLGALVKVLRNNQIVHEGKIISLRHFKEEVKEVRSGLECGIGISQWGDIRVGDTIEVLQRTETPAEM